jgi:hypothetical protein
VGYGSLATLSTIFIPMIYPPVKWFYVLVAYAITPLFALPNSYGCGLTDWDMCSMVRALLYDMCSMVSASYNKQPAEPVSGLFQLSTLLTELFCFLV